MDVARPEHLILAAVVVLAIGRLIWQFGWRQRMRREFSGPQATNRTDGAFAARCVIFGLALGLAVFASARPQWGSKQVSSELRGVDVVIALDISPSMDAQDVAGGSRRTRAKEAAATFAESLLGNRVGLVEFAETAVIRAPLTTDVRVVAGLIAASDNDVRLVAAGTSFPAAFEQAAVILGRSQDTGKAVVLITDGEDHSTRALSAAKELAGSGIVLHTVGVGTASGTTIPVTNLRGTPTAKLGRDGLPIITRLEDARLDKLAQSGGGHHVSINQSSRDILSLRDEIVGLQSSQLDVAAHEIKKERLSLFLLPAVLFLALEWTLQVVKLSVPWPPLRQRPIGPR